MMKTPFSVLRTRSQPGWLRSAVLVGAIGLAAAAGAQPAQPFSRNIACTVIPISPSLPGLNSVSARGLSDPMTVDAAGGLVMTLAGQCDNSPLFQPGILPAGTAWTVRVPLS